MTWMMVPLLLIFAIQAAESLRCLKTNDQGPQKNAACIYPFKIGSITYNECTNRHEAFGQFWCSTKVEQDGAHVFGNWGFCDPGMIKVYGLR